MSEENVLKAPFSLKLAEKKISIPVDDVGTERTFTLRELTGLQRDKYAESVRSRLERDNTGRAIGMKNVTGFFASLISLCLYDETDKLVPAADIQAWPTRLQKWVHDEAEKLSGLDQDAKENAKNE